MIYPVEINHTVNEDGQVVVRVRTKPGDDASTVLGPITMTRAQSAALADWINVAQGRTTKPEPPAEGS